MATALVTAAQMVVAAIARRTAVFTEVFSLDQDDVSPPSGQVQPQRPREEGGYA